LPRNGFCVLRGLRMVSCGVVISYLILKKSAEGRI
jgi:hypothetical protein